MERWTPFGTQRNKQLLAVGDAAVVVLSFVIGLSLRGGTADGFIWLDDPVILAGLLGMPALQLMTMYVLELYEMRGRLHAGVVFRTVLATLITVSVGGVAALLFGFSLRLSSVLGYTAGVCLGSLAWRLWIVHRWKPRATRERVIVLGEDDYIRQLCDELLERQGNILEFLWAGPPDARSGDEAAAELIAFAGTNSVDTVVYPWGMHSDTAFADTLLKLRLGGMRVSSFPEFFGAQSGRIPAETIDSNWISETLAIGDRARFGGAVRRVFERAAALVLGLLLLPVAFLIAVTIKLESRGPAMFVQERLGHRQRPFRLFKFRTMVDDAERDSGPTWARPGDERITRIGAFLRATGFDEIPQLINIVRGEMRFIGVRPIRRHFADAIAADIPYYWHRFFVPPGVTGWAQVMHDYAGSPEGQRRKHEYELFYLRHVSPVLDAAILLKTVKTVLFRRVGAFIEPAEDADEAQGPAPQAAPEVSDQKRDVSTSSPAIERMGR